VRRVTSPSALCRNALLAWTAGFFLAAGCPVSKADVAIALGDSLTAEYEYFGPETIGIYPIRGFDIEPTEATEYAKVTVTHPVRWVSRSWVEVMGLLRPFHFDFGQWRQLTSPWAPPRLSGFERNWAVPGVSASLYEEFFTTGLNSNALFFAFRIPLDNQLRNSNAKRVVVWLGTNDLRAKYGAIAKAYDQSVRDGIVNPLKTGLLDDLSKIIARIKILNPKVQIVVVNLPDLGAAPKIKAEFVDHPDDPAVPNEPNPEDPEAPYETVVQKSYVTAATEAINTAIATLATAQEIGVADVYAITKSLIADTPFFYGAIQFTNDSDPDNEPHALFTRDGFHPNTALQILIARTIIKSFNVKYETRVPGITHAEALRLLRISPREPYNNWIKIKLPENMGFEGQRGPLKDPDGDGLTNLMEYAFDTEPGNSNNGDLPFEVKGPVPGYTGDKSVEFSAAPNRPEIDIAVQYKFGTKWLRVPPDHIIENEEDGSTRVVIPLSDRPNPPFRIKVNLLPPQGSFTTISTVYNLTGP
jgi:GDSL-like Lipase/Acylhydrolase family